MKHRKKLITNKSFAAMWDASSKAKSYRELCSMAYESKYFNPKYLEKNSGIGIEEFYTALEKVYEAYNTSFFNIMEKAEISNSGLRDCFCIPEKSIEAWKSGRNKCPDYIRLMLLRYYHLINLGKYIYTEEYENYLNSIPKVYVESEKDKDKKVKRSNSEKDKDQKVRRSNYEKDNDQKVRKSYSEKDNNRKNTDVNILSDETLRLAKHNTKEDKEEYIIKENENIKENEDYKDDEFYDLINRIPSVKYDLDNDRETKNKKKNNSIVNKTNYLDDILKSRKNKE